MNSIHPSEIDLAIQREVITLCGYGTCPTIKCNNAINTTIVARSDGNLHSIKAGRIHGDNNHYEPFENRALGVLLQ
jgi:hypothetical protein